MSHTTQLASLATGSVAFLLAAADSVPAVKSIADRISCRSQLDEPTLAKTVYRDEDGEASEESLRNFSDKWPRVAIALFSASGLFVTLALAVCTTLKYSAGNAILDWLQFGIWVRRANQGLCLPDKEIWLTCIFKPAFTLYSSRRVFH